MLFAIRTGKACYTLSLKQLDFALRKSIKTVTIGQQNAGGAMQDLLFINYMYMYMY